MSLLIWTGYVVASAIAFFLILLNEKDRRWLYYAVSGTLFAFIFDATSVSLGYYTFTIPFQVFGVPLTVLLAEAFSVCIPIFLFERFLKK
ncbi:MAG: hypothetical protein ACE5J7_00270 [Candidatus Aenigmatarchaeota archaeon]